MAYKESLYTEMVRMAKYCGYKSNRLGTYKDFDLAVGELSQTHTRLGNFLNELEKTHGRYTRFMKRAYKEALALKSTK